MPYYGEIKETHWGQVPENHQLIRADIVLIHRNNEQIEYAIHVDRQHAHRSRNNEREIGQRYPYLEEARAILVNYLEGLHLDVN